MRLRAALVALCLLFAPSAFALSGLGLGFSSGGSGISGYAKANHSGFFQGMFGLTSPDPFVIGDYCVDVPMGEMSGYLGGGAIIQLGQRNATLGLHIPFGIYYQAKTVPLMLNFDLAPGFIVRGDDNVFVDVTFGVRYLFK